MRRHNKAVSATVGKVVAPLFSVASARYCKRYAMRNREVRIIRLGLTGAVA